MERCGALELPTNTESIDGVFAVYHREWRALVKDGNLDMIIEYTNSRGEEYARPLGEIAWHVINHGTYHRGQMRAVAEAQGLVDWPETDLIRFFDEMRAEQPVPKAADDQPIVTA